MPLCVNSFLFRPGRVLGGNNSSVLIWTWVSLWALFFQLSLQLYDLLFLVSHMPNLQWMLTCLNLKHSVSLLGHMLLHEFSHPSNHSACMVLKDLVSQCFRLVFGLCQESLQWLFAQIIYYVDPIGHYVLDARLHFVEPLRPVLIEGCFVMYLTRVSRPRWWRIGIGTCCVSWYSSFVWAHLF